MQVIEVVDPEIVLAKADAAAIERPGSHMADENAMFDRMLPRYLEALYTEGEAGERFPDGGPNRFGGIDPGFVIYDVSLGS